MLLQSTASPGNLPAIEKAGFDVWLPGWWTQQTNWMTLDNRAAALATHSLEYFGQDVEDQYAQDHFFHGRRNGTYLEMGALDGLHWSNTMHFHRHQGWKGVLVEPSPEMYAGLKQNRPDDICVNLAVCSHEQTVHFVSNGDAAVGGIYEFMPPSFRKQWHPSVTAKDVARLPAVACQPLSSVLHKFNVHHIDFFSLDVEGAELEVLQTFPFESTSLGVVVIEADGHNELKDNSVRKLMMNNGLTFHGHVVRNDWFVNDTFVSAFNPLKQMP